MKKIHLASALLLLSAGMAALFAQSQHAQPCAQTSGQIVQGKAVLRSTSGDVQVSYDWERTWQDAVPNMELHRNAVVRTAYGASARISSVNAEIELKEASRLTFEVLPVQAGDKTTVYLETDIENYEGSGALHIDMISRPGLRNYFVVATPGGMTTIYDSSSSWDIDVYSVYVQKGYAEFASTGSRSAALIGPGQRGYVTFYGDTAVLK